MKQQTCRCGWDGNAEHPCHNLGYSCRKPAKRRFYNPKLVALAGSQPKLAITDTWACDACWERFKKTMSKLYGIDAENTPG